MRRTLNIALVLAGILVSVIASGSNTVTQTGATDTTDTTVSYGFHVVTYDSVELVLLP